MDQEMAKKTSDKRLTIKTKTILFELVRAKNMVMSRVIPEGQYWGIYTVYSSNKEYVQQLIDLLHKEKFGAIILLQDKNFSVLKIVWESEYFELPEDV